MRLFLKLSGHFFNQRISYLIINFYESYNKNR